MCRPDLPLALLLEWRGRERRSEECRRKEEGYPAAAEVPREAAGAPTACRSGLRSTRPRTCILSCTGRTACAQEEDGDHPADDVDREADAEHPDRDQPEEEEGRPSCQQKINEQVNHPQI